MSNISKNIDGKKASTINDADRLVKNYSEAAETREAMRTDIEKTAETAHREKEEAIANIHETAGKLKAMLFIKSQSEFFNLVMLKKIKDSKEYRERSGMTWVKFCEYVGVNWRTIDRHLENLEPFRQEFLDSLSNFSGVTLNRIKYLGMAQKDNICRVTENSISYNGETIPVDADHADEIKALLEAIEENHKKKTEELESRIRASDRLIKAKDDVVNRMEKELMRLERKVEKSDLTEEEQDAINFLYMVQSDFVGWINDIDKKIKPHEAPEIALRQLYFLYLFISKVCLDKRMELHESYKDAMEAPWEITEQEIPYPDVMIDNLPMTRGMGESYRKVTEKRAAAKKGKAPSEAGSME